MSKRLTSALTLLALIGATPLLSACDHRGGDYGRDRDRHEDRGDHDNGDRDADHHDDHSR